MNNIRIWLQDFANPEYGSFLPTRPKVYDLEHEPSFFVNNFRLRSRVALSLDSCVRQDTQKKIWAGCCVWGRLYNCFRGSDAFNLLERWISVHEPSFFVNNFRLRGLIALILVSLDSCVHQDTPTKVWCSCYVCELGVQLFRGSNWGLMF